MKGPKTPGANPGTRGTRREGLLRAELTVLAHAKRGVAVGETVRRTLAIHVGIGRTVRLGIEFLEVSL